MPLPDIIVGRNQEDISKYGLYGTGYIGKHIVGEKEDAHLTNKIMLDFLRPHVIGIFGKRGMGKSYSLGILSEELSLLPEKVMKNLSMIIVDTMGIFWSMKEPNEREIRLLNDWGIKPKNIPIKIFIPIGYSKHFIETGLPFDKIFSMKAYDLSVEDWIMSFGIDPIKPIGILLEKIINICKNKIPKFSIYDIIKEIKADKKSSKIDKNALINRFSTAERWGIFSEIEGDSIEELLEPGTISVLDISLFGSLSKGWSIRSLLIGLLARRLYDVRIKARKEEELSIISKGSADKKTPLIWMVIDEAHQFIPNKGETAASEPLLKLVKEGREPGISLVLATQRPNKLHEDVIAQTDIVIAMRLTASQDINALRTVMQTYMLEDIQQSINKLPKSNGAAIILDDNSERILSMQMRPRISWHAGKSPIAITEE